MLCLVRGNLPEQIQPSRVDLSRRDRFTQRAARLVGVVAVVEAALAEIGRELDKALFDAAEAQVMQAGAVDQAAVLVQPVQARVGGGVFAGIQRASNSSLNEGSRHTFFVLLLLPVCCLIICRRFGEGTLGSLAQHKNNSCISLTWRHAFTFLLSQITITMLEFRRPFAVRLRALPFLGVLVFVHCADAVEPAAGRNLGLDQLIALSIQNHPSIAASRAQLGAAQAEVSAARSQYYPTPSVQLLKDKQESTTVLMLQQPLWAGGRLDAGLYAAQSRTNAARVSVNSAQYALALRVTSAWAAWLQARGRSEALEKGVALLNVYAESVSRRIEGGASGEVDRELVAARLAQTQGDLAAARSSERSALAKLAQMTGQPLRPEDLAVAQISTTAISATATTAADNPLPGLDALVAQAVAYSPALKRLEADIETARQESEQRRAALWPTLNLRAERQRSEAAATGAVTNDNRIMLALEYAPGAGLSASANINAAEERVRVLRENLDAARRDLTETIAADYEDYLASSDRKQSNERTIKASAEVLASYDRLFVAGKRNWLDVINATRELIQAQTALADADAQQNAARARLRLHTGEML